MSARTPGPMVKTRTTTLRLVPSQLTERIQAHTNPTVWGEVAPPMSWRTLIWVGSIALVFAALIVGVGR